MNNNNKCTITIIRFFNSMCTFLLLLSY